jgi:hypothetical protein
MGQPEKKSKEPVNEENCKRETEQALKNVV